MGKIGFLFPGQGAQHVGMGRTLAERYPSVRQLYQEAKDILGFDISKYCFEGPQAELDTTEVSQPAIFVTSLACLEMLRAEQPHIVLACERAAGLSLGEYTALVFAGALSFEDGLRVVQQRGKAMQAASDATPSGMVSILLLDADQVEKICQVASAAGSLQIANYLCPGNIVVSGTVPACEKAAELAEQAGGRAVPLAVAGAFHTGIMRPADEKLAQALATAMVKSPQIAVYSNVDAETHSDPQEIREILVKQVVNPVLWEDCIRKMLADGVDQFYEIGPGKVLKGLLKRIDRKIECTTINDS